MPYPAGHRAKTQNRIIESARRLFNKHGFENVSIDSIMEAAGLTRGAFYSYFTSKSDLYSEVLGCFFTDPNWKNRWKGVKVDLASPRAGEQIVAAYLSTRHLNDVENSCPMAALPGDVARCDSTVRAAFERVFTAMVTILSREVQNSSEPPEKTAMAIASLCVGGMVLARSLNHTAISNKLLEASKCAALQLGGWNTDSKSSRSTQRNGSDTVKRRKPGQAKPS